MKTQSLQHKIIKTLAKVGIPESQINPKARLVQDLGFDSIELVSLAVDLERELRIEIDDREVAQLGTMGNLIEYLDKKVQTKKIR